MPVKCTYITNRTAQHLRRRRGSSCCCLKSDDKKEIKTPPSYAIATKGGFLLSDHFQFKSMLVLATYNRSRAAPVISSSCVLVGGVQAVYQVIIPHKMVLGVLFASRNLQCLIRCFGITLFTSGRICILPQHQFWSCKNSKLTLADFLPFIHFNTTSLFRTYWTGFHLKLNWVTKTSQCR